MTTGSSAKLRRATYDDVQLLFDWVNDEDVRKNAIHTAPVSWETHCAWLKSQLEKTDSVIYILESENQAIGQVRLDHTDNHTVITYSIAKEHRGKGWGKHILSEAIRTSPGKRFHAVVRVENHASAHIFRSLGFKQECDQNYSENFLIFVSD